MAKTTNKLYVRKDVCEERVASIRRDIKEMRENDIRHLEKRIDRIAIDNRAFTKEVWKKFDNVAKQLWGVIITTIGIVVGLLVNFIK